VSLGVPRTGIELAGVREAAEGAADGAAGAVRIVPAGHAHAGRARSFC
jgi:hypothetical protein